MGTLLFGVTGVIGDQATDVITLQWMIQMVITTSYSIDTFTCVYILPIMVMPV